MGGCYRLQAVEEGTKTQSSGQMHRPSPFGSALLEEPGCGGEGTDSVMGMKKV